MYRSTGLGSGGNETANLDFINDILILTIDNGKIIDNTNKFIDTLSRSKMFSQDSHFYFEDLDGDKIKDLFIKYDVDSSIVKPYMPFYGYWEKIIMAFLILKVQKKASLNTRDVENLYCRMVLKIGLALQNHQIFYLTSLNLVI